MQELLSLFSSLSLAEKRQFSASRAGVKSAYMHLFNLLQEHNNSDWQKIRAYFLAKFPSGSAEGTGKYLYKLLLQSLIDNKVRNDEGYSLLYGLLQIKMLRERNLHEEADLEVRKNAKLAATFENLPLQLLLQREALDHLSDKNFAGFTEKEIVARQHSLKDLIRDIKTNHDHHTLYELLKFRLSHSSILNDAGKKSDLNDLVLSEIAIMHASSRQTSESKRLHLLFQSFYFVKTKDHRSALRTFYILNDLYEQRLVSLQQPPIDYFNMLEGILDSLQQIGRPAELNYFLVKLESLDRPEHPAYFRLLVRKTAFLVRTNGMLTNGEHGEALTLLKRTEDEIIHQHNLINSEKQLAILLNSALIYYYAGLQKQASKILNIPLQMRQVNQASIYYRMARMLNIVMHYENGEKVYLEHEIRAYKRIFTCGVKILAIEKFLFKVILTDPQQLSRQNNELQWKKLASLRDQMSASESEMKLLQYFNFVDWSERMFNASRKLRRATRS